MSSPQHLPLQVLRPAAPLRRDDVRRTRTQYVSRGVVLLRVAPPRGVVLDLAPQDLNASGELLRL